MVYRTLIKWKVMVNMGDDDWSKYRERDKKRKDDNDEDGEEDGGGIFGTILEYLQKLFGK